MKSTTHLSQEHKVILRTLDVLDAVCTCVEDNYPSDERDIGCILDFLRSFADAHHQAKEEAILFPALKHAASAQGRPIEHLSREHDQERSLVEDLETELRLAKLPQFVASARRLSSALRNHMYKEDRILFPEADAILSSEEDNAVFESLSHFDTALDKQQMEDKLKLLHALEWKYLRK
jgi:hemerythrin-like domain-containing protein